MVTKLRLAPRRPRSGWRALLAAVHLFAVADTWADLSVMQLANEGVMLSDGQVRIIIDGLVFESYAVYGGLPETLQSQFLAASGAFGDITLALASHRHHDHNQPEWACRFLQASPSTRFVSSMQVMDLMRERCRDMVTSEARFEVIDPEYGLPVALSAGPARISAFLLSHGTGKYARLQNFGHLVDFGGVTLLHIGDAAMDGNDFRRAGLDQTQVDVALIPFWFFQPGPGMDVVNAYMDARHKVAVHIPPSELVEVTEYLNANFPDVIVLANVLDQVRFGSDGDARLIPAAQPIP